jgi:hypothetical protein
MAKSEGSISSCMVRSKGNRSSRKKSVKLKPTRKLIKSAVDEYLRSGGKISTIETNREYADIIAVKGLCLESDEYLVEE